MRSGSPPSEVGRGYCPYPVLRMGSTAVTTMKELTTVTKSRVIKLFLTGYSYDDIDKQVGVGKGLVSSIDERQGTRVF